MKKYKIWDKKTNILTPIGEILTPEQWIQRHPIAGIENITVICAGGEINGAIFDTLSNLVEKYEDAGLDFSSCHTDEDKISLIEDYENQKRKALREEISNEELTATSLASIAASLEYQNMLTLDDVEVE